MRNLIKDINTLETALKGTLPSELRTVMTEKYRKLDEELNVKINEIEVV